VTVVIDGNYEHLCFSLISRLVAEGEEQFKLHGSGKTMDGQIVFARYVVMEPFGKGEWDRKVERKAPLIMKARLEAIIDGER
jgi:hypothetical protein